MSTSVTIQQHGKSIEVRKTITLLVLTLVIALLGSLTGLNLRSRANAILPLEPRAQELIDNRLKQAAISALQGREGTIILIDPQTGRIRAAVNSRLAFDEAFAPGSTIKPFVALSAIHSNLIKADSRVLCHATYSHEDFQTVCSHPEHLAPLNPSEAIAYSCNYYFGKLGERLEPQELTTLLSSFGFGRQTNIDSQHEAAGRLSQKAWRPEHALGDADYIEVTPVQMLLAYSALINGGHLFTPQDSPVQDFTPKLRNEIQITDPEREVILEGLRGAVRYGTAERAQLSSIPLYIVGKTGTSLPSKGFRTHGWFVGFASKPGETIVNARLGLVVFLKRSHGAEAAEISRSIFEEYANSAPIFDNKSTHLEWTGGQQSDLARLSPHVLSDSIQVHLARENVTRAMSLEDYVVGVVAAEGSTENQLEALKALAVASRSYALKNLQRHATEGFDFCNTTHCQRFSSEQASNLVRKAVSETEGQVVQDPNGNLAETYFSASCGGETANIGTLWGGSSQPYLQGVKDEYCGMMPHSHWTDVIPEKDLKRAFESDSRFDVGDELRNIVVSRRDKTGRAERITLVGKRQRIVSGWNLKILVGRALGWNFLKSSRFQVSRSGSNFIFHGSGFGHGLGLCQEGAHVMAERAFEYRQILSKYFPGTTVVTRKSLIERSTSADLIWTDYPEHSLTSIRTLSSDSDRRFTSSEHFRVSYPGPQSRADAEYLLQLLETMRNNLITRSTLPKTPRVPLIEVFLNRTTGDFVGRTGLPAWAAAASQTNQIELQPVAILKKRGILETTLRHELVHKIVDSLGNGRVPRWLAEGLALNLAGEGPMISRYEPKQRIPLAELESRLMAPADKDDMRQLYAAAYGEVHRLIESVGEAAVWQRISGGEN